MEIKNDIKSLEDIKILVDTFYHKVREDSLLAPIFNDIIEDRWPDHLNKMYTFWQTVLLEDHTYYGSPFPPHAKLPIRSIHFERWLALFKETLDHHFSGVKAQEAKWRSEKMAEMFLYKINHYRKNPSKPLI